MDNKIIRIKDFAKKMIFAYMLSIILALISAVALFSTSSYLYLWMPVLIITYSFVMIHKISTMPKGGIMARLWKNVYLSSTEDKNE